MSDYENNGCFCLDELTDGKASLKRLTDAPRSALVGKRRQRR